MATVYSLVCWGGSAGRTPTMTIASPCVVTLTAHGLRDGFGVVFTTSGALPTGVTSGTTYYAKRTAANTINLYDTAANAIAGGATGRVNTSGTQSGTHTAKSANMLALDTTRWSTRIYDGIFAWKTGRTGCSPYDIEVCELLDGYSQATSATFDFAGAGAGDTTPLPSAKNIITSRINGTVDIAGNYIGGTRTDAWHQGVYPTSSFGTQPKGYIVYPTGFGTGAAAIRLGRYRDSIEGFSIWTDQSGGLYYGVGINTSAAQSCVGMFIIYTAASGTVGIENSGALALIANNVVSTGTTNGIGINNVGNNRGSLFVGNIVTRCLTGINSGVSTNYGFYYNNIAVANTTDWGATNLLNIEGASQNAGSGTTAWMIGTGSTRIASFTTAEFTTYGANITAAHDYSPALSTSLQVEVGLTPYGIPTTDLAGDVRPNYRPTPAGIMDVGAYEYDWGNGLAPETLLTITGLLAGSTVRIFASGTQTEQASTTNSGTSYAPTGLTGTVDYTIYKDSYLPIRVTGIALVSGSPQSASGAQTTDRAFVASSGLTYGTTATVNTSTLRFAITTATTGQNWYSFWVEQYRSHADLRNKPFPLQANGPNSFSLGLGYEFDAAPSIAYLSRDGMRYVDTGGTQTAVWAAILTAGVSSGMRVRYQQSDGGTTGGAVITSGNMDELVQIYGDASHGNFDKRGYLVLKVQEAGYDEAYIDVVGQYGTLEDQLYVVALSPLANGVATGNPSLANPPTITDHGASPATWHSKAFSLTITDSAAGNTGTNIMRWLRHYFETGGTFQSKDAFNWHDLVQVNGSDFKTVRGIIYGDTGASLKGVRVVMNDGTTDHPDVTLYTADDGTTYATPVVAVADATVLVDTRVQLYNVTQATEIENVFSTGTAYSYTITTEADVGDTLRLRACKKGREAGEAFAVWGAAGVTFLVSQSEDTIYTTWGIDGATVTEYSLDGPNLQIDANDVDGASTKTRLGAFYSYALTTEIGIRNFYGALSFLSSAAIRVNVDVANLYVENTNATTALYFTDLSVRLYKSDGTSIIAATSYSIHNDYSGVPDVVETGVSGLTGGESAQLMALPSSTANATAILAAAAVTPIHSDAKKMNGATILGVGTAGDKWRG